MIHLTRTILFHQIKSKYTFLIFKKNSSEFIAVKSESEIIKKEIQEDSKEEVFTKLKENLLSSNSSEFDVKNSTSKNTKTKIQEDITEEIQIATKNQLTNLDTKNSVTEYLPTKERYKSKASSNKLSKVLYNFEPTNFNKIYDLAEAQNMTQMITPLQAIEVMKILITLKTRPPLLLKALSLKIGLGIKEFNLKNNTDAMYCSAVLSFKDITLLDELAKNIIAQKDNLTEKFATSILYSCGKLKYRNCELIDSMLTFILSQKSSTHVLLTGLMTLGIVNFMSLHGVVLINELLKLSCTEFPLTSSYINFVWSCILINQFPVNHISKILSKDFIEHIKTLYGSNKYFVSITLKLQNINAAATYLMPSYKGPKLEEDNFIDLKNKEINSQFFISVIDGLNHIFPKTGYLNTNVDTGAGFLLDIECYMNKQIEPLPLKKKNGIKIGIMLIQFNDVCLGRPKTICGIAKFKERILEAQGYKVIQIFWDDYNANFKLYDKVNYLRQKLKECILS